MYAHSLLASCYRSLPHPRGLHLAARRPRWPGRLLQQAFSLVPCLQDRHFRRPDRPRRQLRRESIHFLPPASSLTFPTDLPMLCRLEPHMGCRSPLTLRHRHPWYVSRVSYLHIPLIDHVVQSPVLALCTTARSCMRAMCLRSLSALGLPLSLPSRSPRTSAAHVRITPWSSCMRSCVLCSADSLPYLVHHQKGCAFLRPADPITRGHRRRRVWCHILGLVYYSPHGLSARQQRTIPCSRRRMSPHVFSCIF